MRRWLNLWRRTVASRSTRMAVLAVCAGLLLITALWGLSYSAYRRQHRDLESQTWLRAGQVARAVAVQVQTLLSGLDHTMRSLQTVYASGNLAAFDAAVETALDAYPDGAVVMVLVTDAQGTVVYSSLNSPGAPPVGTSIRDQPQFTVHARNQAIGMFVGGVIQGGPAVGRRRIPLSRSMQRDGVFAGVLVLALSPTYIGHYLQAILAGPQEVITLLRDDGAYLARSHALQQVLGRSMTQQQLQRFPAGAQHGAYAAPSSIDQVPRLYAWNRVPGYPLIVSAGLSRQGVFAVLDQTYESSNLRNVLITLFILASLALIVWQGRQHQRSDLLRQREERRFAQLVQQVPGNLFQYHADAAGRLWLDYASQGFIADHGMEPLPEAQLAADLLHSVYPDDLPMLRDSLHASVAAGMPWECTYRIGKPDGVPLRWMHAHARPQREDDGALQWYGYVYDVTQEQIMLETVRSSEERLRLTVGAVGDGLWQWDCDSGTVQWDERCFAMLGLPPGALDMSYDAFMAMVHPQDVQRFQDGLLGHLEHGARFRLDVRLRTANGTWRWIETRGEIMQRHADGRAQRMLGTHTDVQQRVEREQLLTALLDRGNALILMTDAGRHILYANERAASTFGLVTGQQPPGLSVRGVYQREQDYLEMGQIIAALDRQASVRTERELRMPDGTAHWFDMQASPLHPQEGDAHLIWTMTDIDERYRAVEALSQAQRRLSALVNRFPYGILVADPGLRVVGVNQAFMAIAGMAQDDQALLGIPMQEWGALSSTPLDWPHLLSPAEEGAENKKTHVLPDGRHLEIEAMQLRSGAQVLGHCWVCADVTERSRRESRLQTMALTDALTGVPNRRAFMLRLEDELSRLRKGRVTQSALVMIDIDFFKRINDSYGHAVGDVALKQLGALLLHGLRRQDIVARMGGEEFAVLLSGADMQACAHRVEHLRERAAALQVPLDEGQWIGFTISLGMCMLQPGDLAMDEYLNRADTALYFSKRHGRNQSMQWSPDLPNLAAG